MKLKKALSICLMTAMIASISAPVAAFADESGAMSANSYPTVAAHRAAEPSSEMLGFDLVTMGADSYNSSSMKMLDIFGSNKNTQPSPHLYNLKNGYTSAAACTQIITQTVAPNQAEVTATTNDGTTTFSSVSVSANPTYYLGIADRNGHNYSDMGVPDSQQIAYNSGSLYDMIDTMYNLAGDNLTGRYGNAEAIAETYEAYIRETQLYVLSQIADTTNTVTKKTVAIVGQPVTVNNVTYYPTYKYTTPNGQIAYRTAEYLENTTTNIVDTLSASSYLTDEDANGNTIYLLTASQLKNADKIISFHIGLTPGLTSSQVTTLETTLNGLMGENETAPEIITGTPQTAYGILMNSTDNALGVGILNSIVYDEILDVDAAVAYFYANLYHVKNEEIDSLTDDEYSAAYNWAVNITDQNVSGKISAYAMKLQSGLTYYTQNMEEFEDTDLELSFVNVE